MTNHAAPASAAADLTPPAVPLAEPTGSTTQEEPVRVPLQGRHGEGRFALLDGADWRTISAVPGGRLTVTKTADGNFYVTTTRGVARALGNDHTPSLLLHRLLVGARPGEMVAFVSGDSMDQRRANLLRMSEEQAWRWRQAQALKVRRTEQ